MQFLPSRTICFVFAILVTVQLPMGEPSFRAAAQSSSSSPSEDKGSLAWQATQAKAEGRTSITIATPDELVAGTETLDDAIAHTSLILAKVFATQVVHDRFTIYTWRKYHVLERLSSQPMVREHALPESLPGSLLPIDPGDFVIAAVGGTVDIDGVSITMRDSQVHDPASDKPHLMFLLFFNAASSEARSNYGPEGLFWIDDSDTIHACINAERNPLYSELLDRTDGKLSNLRKLASQISAR